VRLSILDLSAAGHQPMADSSGRFVLTYNGEVYNFQDLREELLCRHGPIAWRGGSDTEVIVEGFAREGKPFLARMNGIFALAIFDQAERVLYVLRDPLGIKPLFVTEQNGAVCFGSEIKALTALPGVRRTLRRQSLADQLAFMYVPEPYTPYEEILKVEPGVCLSFRQGGLIAAERLFQALDEPIKLSSKSDAIERLRSAFAAAVERQLVADVPVSLFLSGGLDSSAVAQQIMVSGANVRNAYTIAFRDEDRRLDGQSEDLKYARLMSKRLGIRLDVIEAQENFVEELPRLVAYMEDGFSDPAAINTYLISSRARQAGVKVLLSGQGADEFLGGYRRYVAERLLASVPRTLHTPLAHIARAVSNATAGRLNAVSRRAARLAGFTDLPPNERLFSMYSWTTPQVIEGLFSAPVDWTGDAAFKARFDLHRDRNVLDAMMRLDEWYDLMSLNLCYTDRMSMAVGVEVRVPFLDFELVQLMRSIPVGWKVHRGQGKHVFKKAMEGILPREVIYREKAGFSLPIRAWLRRASSFVDDWLGDERLRRQGIFNAAAVHRLVVEQRSGQVDRASTLFTLICQQVWLDHELETA
jgi:asparagine synthase (glutamine-hydrolysing)